MGLHSGILDFSTSTNPLGMHHTVRERLASCIGHADEYPDANCTEMERDLAAYAGVRPQNVVASNGATALIHDMFRLMAKRQILLPGPTFGEYQNAAESYGCRIRTFYTKDIGRDAAAFSAEMPRGGCAVLCNPSAPAGALASRQTILDIVRAGRDAKCAVVVDECFIEMTPGRSESVAAYTAECPNLVVVRSMTKSFGLAGLRAGYCIAPEEMAGRLRAMRAPWSVNILAQAAALQALRHPEHLEAARKIIREQMPIIYESIASSPGMEPCRTDANYMIVRTPLPARTVQMRLLGRGILVRDCSSFGMPEYIRVSAKTGDKNKILCEGLVESCRA